VSASHGTDLQWASLAETSDSPMKPENREVQFDAARFLRDERIRAEQGHRRQQHFVEQNVSFRRERDRVRETEKPSEEQAFASIPALAGERLPDETPLAKQKRFREGLNEQVAARSRLAEEKRAREAQDAAEVKMRTLQELERDLAEQNRRREMARQVVAEDLKRADLRRQQRRDEKDREIRESHQTTEKAREWLPENHRQAAKRQQEEIHSRLDSIYRQGQQTVKAEALKRQSEEARWDRDEKIHNLRTDLLHSRRDEARERQRIRMVSALEQQVNSRGCHGPVDRLSKQLDLQTANEIALQGLEADFQRQQEKRKREKGLQQDLVAMMGERQLRHQEEGYRPPPLAATMSGIAGATRPIRPTAPSAPHVLAAEPSSGSVPSRQEVNADITRSAGIGGVVGVFAGEGGHTSAALKATKGLRCTEGAPRRHRASWSHGLSRQELQAGQRAAAQRQAAAAEDKREL